MENKKEISRDIAEVQIIGKSGINALISGLFLILGAVGALFVGILLISASDDNGIFLAVGIILFVIGLVWGIIILCGIRQLEPQTAYVFTYFGEYKGTLRGPGYFYVNVLHEAVKPCREAPSGTETATQMAAEAVKDALEIANKTISLKTKTLNNKAQKINDVRGNPIVIDTMVVWRIADTARAMFNVENYWEYLSMQSDAALRKVVSLYPFDASDGAQTVTLRSAGETIEQEIKTLLQEKADLAGLLIEDVKITNLSYAPEVAAVMLQRQQAVAIVEAKHAIVEGAVDIVEMALRRINANDICKLDDKEKAAMVSNLLVSLCGNKEASPVLNVGS